MAKRADICTATLDIFVRALAGALGNMSLVLLPMGGVYLGKGGIPPRIQRLQQPDFIEAIRDRDGSDVAGRRIPVHVILDPRPHYMARPGTPDNSLTPSTDELTPLPTRDMSERVARADHLRIDVTGFMRAARPAFATCSLPGRTCSAPTCSPCEPGRAASAAVRDCGGRPPRPG